MSRQPYAVRLSAQAAKVLDTLPEHVEDTVWDVLDAAAGDPCGFGQWNTDHPEGEDVRYASVGRLSLTYWVNRPLRRLTVLNIVWLGQPAGQNAPPPALQQPDRGALVS
ncbi:hypothetical protein [Streptomyces sp. H51]|uniref:hypothetical protein n=1 Tax=Streptomyces sp. H51 TaxID=3111770 RepID=UPI002D79DFD3|nr:hypothetical protein [Streptomyces sp. H51]